MRLKLLSSCLLVALAFAAATPSASAQWTDLGSGLAGTGGVPPVMSTLGGLFPTSGTKLSIAGALPSAPAAFLVVGFTNISAPFKGGTLVPFPNYLVPISIDGLGNWQMIFSWPNMPSGFLLYWQVWLKDPLGPQDFAASNAWESAAI